MRTYVSSVESGKESETSEITVECRNMVNAAQAPAEHAGEDRVDLGDVEIEIEIGL